MSKNKNSRSFILQQKNSFTNYDDSHHPASDLDENSLFDDHRVPHFGGQQEEYRFSNDDLESPVGNNSESDEEDEADLLSELRQLSRNMATTGSKKKPGKGIIDDLIDDEDKPKTSVKEFEDYYQRSFKRFLTKKESDIEKLRKQKEDSESKQLKRKPDLVAKQANKKHIPISERVDLIQAKKEKELMMKKKQKEEKLEKELSQLTFKPKINQNYALDHVVIKQGDDSPLIKKYQSNREVLEVDQLDMGRAKSRNAGAAQKGVTENNQRNIIDKLYANTQNSQPNQGNKAKKQDTATQQQQPSNTASQNNRVTHKIARSTTEVVETAKQPDNKKAVLSHAKTQDMPAEASKIQLIRDQRESSNTPTRELDNRNYRSQGQPQRTSDFINAQEELLQKLQEVAKASPQKNTNTNMLEGLLNLYSAQKSQANQPERQTIEVKPIPIQEETPRDKSPLAGRSPQTKPENKSPVQRRSPSKEPVSPTKVNTSIKSVVTPSSQLTDSIREETMEDHEDTEIASIKQNILSIQDNIQSLKLSFKNFQEAQAAPKVESSTNVETPRQAQKVSFNTIQQANQQISEKKISQPINTAPVTEAQPVIVKKEVQVPVVENRSKTPPPSTSVLTAVKRNSPGENKAKNLTPTPAQKKNAQIIKISSEESGYSRRVARPVQEQQVHKVEEMKENYSSVRDVEPPSFGNLSFANEKKFVPVVGYEKEDKQIKKEDAYSSVKSKGEQGGIEPANYYSKSKTGGDAQSLKDVAQMTLMKFKNLGQKTGGAGEGYAAGYASMKRVNK